MRPPNYNRVAQVTVDRCKDKEIDFLNFSSKMCADPLNIENRSLKYPIQIIKGSITPNLGHFFDFHVYSSLRLFFSELKIGQVRRQKKVWNNFQR